MHNYLDRLSDKRYFTSILTVLQVYKLSDVLVLYDKSNPAPEVMA